MKTYKLSGSYYGTVVFLMVLSVLFSKCGYMLLLDYAIGKEDSSILILAIPFILAGTAAFISVATMIMQIFFYKGIGIKLSEEGISDTLVYAGWMMFNIIIPVKFIPWDAILNVYWDSQYRCMAAEVDISKVKASKFGKFVLKHEGYYFRDVKPKPTREEILDFLGWK